MTKAEQTRLLTWRFKLLQRAGASSRNVARTCRHFGISRKSFYKWKKRYEADGEAGLCDRATGTPPWHAVMLTDHDYAIQALVLDRPDEPICVGIAVRSTCRGPDDPDPSSFQEGHDCPAPRGITIADQHAAVTSDALVASDVAQGLEDERLVRIGVAPMI